MRKRLGIISLFVILFIAFITIWNYSYYKGQEEAYIPIENVMSWFQLFHLRQVCFNDQNML